MMANILATALLLSALSVSAQGQDVTCKATSDCSDTGDLGMMTVEDCCVNTPNAFGFSAGGSCSPCIVFGFLEDSFTGVERGQSHSVEVGYRKGADSAQTNIPFNVRHTEGNAHEGAGNDYTISTNQVRALYNQEPEIVQFIFRSDSIAQETNETFTLRLEPTAPLTLTGDGVFFVDEMNITILDSDLVNIFFTEDDFRGNEDNPVLQVPVMVVKSSRIATRIVLEVVPLTVEQARSTMPLRLPENIPVNNPFAPPYADLNDFNNSVITVTFEPDENANDDERATPIPIVDDLINEATEQSFVVQLRLVESVNQSSVILTTRPASLCRIVDNDIIRIGFEQSSYTYIESMRDEPVEDIVNGSGPIYLVKQDNVASEQTFIVIVQVTNSVPVGTNFQPATFPKDYSTGSEIIVLQFLRNMQRLKVQVQLIADNEVEGTEAFLMTSAPGDQEAIETPYFVPGYLSPTTLSTDAFVIIEDDDVAIRIGFEETAYTVDESVGTFDVYVKVFVPPDNQSLPLQIDLTIETTARTAGEADYQRLSAQALNIFLRFDDATRRQSFPVTIKNDDISELIESFVVELRFDPFIERPPGVELSPNVSTITINDTDSGPLISFERESYTVLESEDFVEVCFLTSKGHIEPIEVEIRPVEKNVDNPATGNSDFLSSTITKTFQVSDMGNMLCANISLIEDTLYEGDEQFLVIFGNLPSADAGVGLINETTVIIQDNEVVPKFNIGPNITINESTPEVEICISTTTRFARNFVVTAVTGPKNGVTNQATENVDYISTTIMLTFEPKDEGMAEMCAKVEIIDDMLGNEPDEVFSVRLVNVASTGSAEACVTIEDNDTPVVEWEFPEITIPEGATGEICFTTNIGTATSYVVERGEHQNLIANPATSDDYEIQPSPQAITIPKSSSGERFCINVTTTSDTELEGDEQFSLHFANLPSEFADVGETDMVLVTIEDAATPPITCQIIEPLRVQPFSRNTTYGFMGTCEHTALRSCNPIPGFNVRVNVDFLTESMENGAVGLLVNDLRYVSREDGSFDDGGQTPLSSTTTRREYESSDSRIVVNLGGGENNITYSVIGLAEDDPFFIKITVMHVYAGNNPLIQVNVEAPDDTLHSFCGLCGSRSGDLVRPDGSIAQRMNLAAVQSFAQSYLVEPREQILRPQRRECGTVRNDTIIGDPLYTVPVYNEAGKEYSLCYEVFGRTNSTLNLVSDTCVNVNARYSAMDNPELGNIISSIGVRAKGMTSNSCYNIRVDLAGCSATIESPGSDPLTLTDMQSEEVDGISVKKYPSRVRISAPNCENVRLVTWVMCENRNDQDMIKFVIARGVNLRASSHGLLGQFWNIPVTFTKYNGTDLPSDYNPEDIYVVEVQPESGPIRSFLGEFYHLTWDKSREPCLYVGTAQGGPTYEVKDPNDSVIEGDYRDYIIDNGDLFETTYKYVQFDEGRC